MIKRIFCTLTIFVLLHIFNVSEVKAQGTFMCSYNRLTNPCFLRPEDNHCVSGVSEPLFPDGKACEDIDENCPAYVPYGCKTIAPPPPPPGPPPPPPPSSYDCAGATSKTICDGNVIIDCDANGQVTFAEDCQNYGKVCKDNVMVLGKLQAVCDFPAPPPPPPGGQPPPPPPPPGQTGGGAPVVNLNQLIDSIGFKTFKSTSTLGDIINVAVPILLAIAGTGLLLYLISGGFSYLTSAGDPKKMEAAKTVITNAVIGFIIIISAYFITQAVSFIFKLGGAI